MRIAKQPALPAKQKYAANLLPGDVVAVATGTSQDIGVFKGHGAAGNKQIVIERGWRVKEYVVKGIPYTHENRIVKVNLKDLDLDTQNKLAPIIEKYKQR